ncbi:unnamed protein product [[Candida] boidinii]|uniref:Unnamed protein product n=1 Tax=Candida boidinii TaxID=5477 RepID=A0A9W6SVV0_CANBO|nr:hypothetical protein B5S30_g177 [[Candida] boidinii]GME67270.1 unnamed protein product [[Candida] boidinii]
MKSHKIYKDDENYLNLGNLVADKVLDIYNNPKNYLKNDNKLIKRFNNGKPRVKSNGVPEWTVLASIVALIPPVLKNDDGSIPEEPSFKRQKLNDSQDDKENKNGDDDDGEREVKDIIENYTIKPITITTGVKSLPTDIIENKSNGKLIHDMHAEILSIRLFNYILLEECIELKKGSISKSELIEIDDNDQDYKSYETETKFKIKRGIKFALYISEIPCGDASIDNICEQSKDKQIWGNVNYIENKNGTNNEENKNETTSTGVIRGRENFSIVGKVRTKPGRKDSKLSNCKSCSDKLSLLQFKSIINSINFNQFNNFKIENYLKFIILPKDKINDSSIQRCFYDRFFNKLNKPSEEIEELIKDCKYTKIKVIPTNYKFKDSKKDSVNNTNNNTNNNSDIKQTPSNLSILYSPMNNYVDVLNQGLKNGCLKKNYENISDNDQVSISRFKLIKLLTNNFKIDEKSINSYNSFKDSLKNRQELKKLVKLNLFDSWDDSINDDFKI